MNIFLITGNLLPTGINSLLRMHWAVRRKKQAEIMENIQELNPHYSSYVYTDPVRVEYTRKSIKYMDWDNAAGSFKLLGDSLVDLEILPDDNPLIIQEFVVKQNKVAKRIEQGFEIKICAPHSLPELRV